MYIKTDELGKDPESVYINVNTFDYAKLITRIVKHTGLEDSELTDSLVRKIFKDLAVAFNNNKRANMSDEEIKVAETFMKEFAGLRFADYDDEEAAEFYTALSESIEWSLQNFQEFMTGGMDEESVSDETKAFYFALLNLMDMESFLDEEDGEKAMITMERLQEILDDYMTGDLNELQLCILSEMEKLLDDKEIITKVTIEDRPGRIFKNGDSLVTFPTIMMKATNYGHFVN